jgi:hypothetical protein
MGAVVGEQHRASKITATDKKSILGRFRKIAPEIGPRKRSTVSGGQAQLDPSMP